MGGSNIEETEVLKRIIKKTRSKLPFTFPFGFKEKIPEFLLSIKEEDLLSMMETQDQYCHQCGQCCRSTSYVDILPSELIQISEYWSVDPNYLIETFRIKQSCSIMRIPASPCPFYRDYECSIYPVRPQVCSSYPMGAVLSRFKKDKPFILTNCPGLVDVIVNFIVGKIENLAIHKKVYCTPYGI